MSEYCENQNGTELDYVIDTLGRVAINGRDGFDVFITEILLNIGCRYLRTYGAELINVIKLFALHPDVDMNALQAKRVKCGELETSYATIIKKSFDVNDVKLYENIEKLTSSKVYTAVEAVYNISNFVRMEYCIKKERLGGTLGA